MSYDDIDSSAELPEEVLEIDGVLEEEVPLDEDEEDDLFLHDEDGEEDFYQEE